MKNYSMEQIRNVVLLGHGGCGKTTMAEAMLYVTGQIKRQGKVDDGNTVGDYDPEEIRRKVSINTSIIPVEWKDTKINILDTLGYFDFVGEVSRQCKGGFCHHSCVCQIRCRSRNRKLGNMHGTKSPQNDFCQWYG